VRPLKIGIDRDLQQALDVHPAVLRTVLGGYTRRRAYRAALAAPGAMRVDLAGQPVKPGQHILSTSAELSRLDTMLPTGFPSLSIAPLRLPGRSPAPLALREDRGLLAISVSYCL
jgi:hypothetical protein